MRRLAVLAAALAACTSPTPAPVAGPLDRLFFPTGLAVLPVPRGDGTFDERLLVASSNADLTYASDTGGSVMSLGVDPQALVGALNIQSFSGEIGLATPEACPALKGASAVVPVRGTNLVYRLGVGADGALSCVGCDVAVGSAERGDPFSVGVACGPGFARAFVGYLRTNLGLAWFTQIDLLKSPGDDGYVRHRNTGDPGAARGFAYDASRSRLYVTRTGASGGSLRWVDLADGCLLDQAVDDGGCRSNATKSGEVPTGLELRKIALAHEATGGGAVRRAYITARLRDPAASASATTFDGYLLVVDLSESAAGNLTFTVVDRVAIGYGAEEVAVLPARPGKRDVVAALATQDGVVWIYDDETGARVAIGRDLLTGAPLTGHDPFGMAVDPVPLAGNVARVYVASFSDSFVSAIAVPLDAPERAALVTAPDGAIRRIGPKVTP